ncbi:MAG: HAMP domain-containing sensor histidine kinase, partial [Candidatus Omnitrophota bacterium]
IKTLYRELEKKAEELKALDKLKSEFISTVSHELRTPLTIIRESVAQVLDGLLGETTKEQREFLSVGLEDIDRLGRIINNLLDISKIERGKMEIKREKINLAEILDSAETTFMPIAKNKNIEIKAVYSQDEILVYAEKDKIIQVFNNLIGNALKFTDKGGITISAVEKKNKVECAVSDTGRGIKKEDVPKLFSKFQQFGRTAGAGEKGTGLGLAISKAIIELYEGKIKVESDIGKGTTFTFTILQYTAKQLFDKEVKRNMEELKEQETPFTTAVMCIKDQKVLEEKIGKEKLSDILDKFEYMGTRSLNYIQSFVIRDEDKILFVLPSTGKENADQIIERLKKTFSDLLIQKGVTEKIDLDFTPTVHSDV